MRLLSIASGSSGNCIYVGDDTTHILIDAGISGKLDRSGTEFDRGQRQRSGCGLCDA